MSEIEVVEFETAHGVALPSDYRSVLLLLGNGGCGFFKLGTGDFEAEFHSRFSDLAGRLSAPFPHTMRWNAPIADIRRLQDPRTTDSERSRLESAMYGAEHTNGAFPISDAGCATWDFLVVAGPEAGHVWRDGRADYRGLWPHEIDGQRLTFTDWWASWMRAQMQHLLGLGRK